MVADYYARTTCRLCEGADLEHVLHLTPTPPGNNFLRADQLDEPEPTYPLELYFCKTCFHVQLGHVVRPDLLFRSDYFYVSGTSSSFVDHLRDYTKEVVRRFNLQPGSLIGDIGSNDGTCLRFFKEAGMRVLGIDPAANLAKRATEAGIETLAEFFDAECGRRLRERYGPAAFVTSHNACAHIDDLAGVLEGVKHWLVDGGLFGIEVGYLLDVYQNTLFDTIYHEHLDYHSVAPLDRFFASRGMQLVSAERVRPQGGSIRLIARKSQDSRVARTGVDPLIDLERSAGLHRADTFRAYQERIDGVRAGLSKLVRGLKAEGKSIAAFGAPTKSTTLLTQLDLGDGLLDFIVDDNPLKQGLFSPLFHIPVLAPAEVYQRRPDFLVILAWNFAEPIMQKHARYRAEGGRFILPLPEPRIV